MEVLSIHLGLLIMTNQHLQKLDHPISTRAKTIEWSNQSNIEVARVNVAPREEIWDIRRGTVSFQEVAENAPNLLQVLLRECQANQERKRST